MFFFSEFSFFNVYYPFKQLRRTREAAHASVSGFSKGFRAGVRAYLFLRLLCHRLRLSQLIILSSYFPLHRERVAQI